MGGWSLQCIEGVEGCCLSAGGVSENQSSGHHLKTGLQGLRLWFLNSSGSFQDHVFPSLCLSKGYFSDSGPRPTLVTQGVRVLAHLFIFKVWESEVERQKVTFPMSQRHRFSFTALSTRAWNSSTQLENQPATSVKASVIIYASFCFLLGYFKASMNST